MKFADIHFIILQALDIIFLVLLIMSNIKFKKFKSHSMQIEFMMDIIIDEMVNKFSIDISHIIDKYSHSSSFFLSEEFKI